ncbi:hypothetical protein WMY93_007739 [Mugilogobius chulae]|uniref:Uncharacterized protein n=1 Tax=Mugilogobius chulae TaxID=88201 RepID=A0AAW0PDV8_9GOBI
MVHYERDSVSVTTVRQPRNRLNIDMPLQQLFQSLTNSMSAKNITSEESRGNKGGPLHKKRPGRVPNGLRFNTSQTNHQHVPSDQENNPRLAQAPGKRKKKHINKKRSMAAYLKNQRQYANSSFHSHEPDL